MSGQEPKHRTFGNRRAIPLRPGIALGRYLDDTEPMQSQTKYYLVVPLLTNMALSIGAFWYRDAFQGDADLCYFIAVFATFCGFVSIGGFLLHDIGLSRAVTALFVQALFLVSIFASIYSGFGLNDVGPVEWGIAIYFSVVTWTTLGYGDFKPAPE